MASLYYPKRMRYTDRKRDVEFIGPGRFDVPDDAVDEYLAAGWERPDSDDGSDGLDESDGSDGSAASEATAEKAASGSPETAEQETSNDTPETEDDDSDATTAASDDEGDEGDVEICGAELTSGGTCERPADECPYPTHREQRE